MKRMSKYWQRQDEGTTKREQRVAKAVGGKRVAGSGSTPWAKEDIRTDKWLIQHKHTDGASISLTKIALENLARNAIDAEREPLMMLEYGRTNYYVIEEHLFHELKFIIENN